MPREEIMASSDTFPEVLPVHAGYPRSDFSKNSASGRFWCVRREALFLMHLRITCYKGQPPLLSWHSFSIVREVGNGFDHQFVIPINQILKGDAGLDAINLAAYSEQM